MAHLRNVLVTNTHKDARVTAFLVTWAFEKFWIADALRAIVDASAGRGRRPGRRRAPAVEPPAPTPRAADLGAARHPAVAAPCDARSPGFTQGWAVIGAHMAVGLVDDRVLGAAYARVAECVHGARPSMRRSNGSSP